MDSITHLALGAVIGRAMAGKIPPKKAMAVGAIAQSLPDIDFIASLWLDPANNLLAHRGFTHSILFAVTASSFLALIMDRQQKKAGVGVRYWSAFFILQVFVHLFIDVMNVYGVGLLEPFAHHRFSLNVLFVADPLFSFWPVIAAMGLMFTNMKKWQARWAMIGIGGPCLYLIVAITIKLSVLSASKKEFVRQDIDASKYMVTPTPLNTMLWYIVAEQRDGYLIGYRSIFDEESPIFTFHPRNDRLLEPVHQYKDLQHLKRFSQGYYVVTDRNGDLIFNDLRFGQVFGWIDPHADFTFQYYLEQPDTNTMVVQRGRFAKVTQRNIAATLKRIAGN